MQALQRWQSEIGSTSGVASGQRKAWSYVQCRLRLPGSEEAEEDMQPSLVMYDDDKKVFWAAGVQSKAVNEPVVKFVKNVLGQSGYEGEKICFKSDQEVSIVAVKRAVAAARMGETVPIESPVRASKSNGMMESAIASGRARSAPSRTSSRRR